MFFLCNILLISLPLDRELARIRTRFVDGVSKELISQLLDDLLDEGVLNDGEKDSILEENQSRADKARCLIDIVKKKGNEACRKMIVHFQERDPLFSADLGLRLPV